MAEFHLTTLALVRRGEDYSLRQIALLAYLVQQISPTARSVAPAAQHLNISAPATTRAADRLETNGLVLRMPNPGDRRLVDIAVTAKGREFIEAIHEGRKGSPRRKGAPLPVRTVDARTNGR